MIEKQHNIFIVDDDFPVRRSLCRLLSSYGFSVQTYPSAQDFLDTVPSDADGCLILDVKMPGINGLDLQSRLNISGSKIPIIFITAYDNPHDRERAMKLGAVAFLLKPLEDVRLLEAIHLALNIED